MIIYNMEGIVVLAKNRQWICKLIVLFIFISGMCFEDIKADPVFVCPAVCTEKSRNESDLTGQEEMPLSVYMEKETEVTETIIARSTTNVQQIIASISNGKRTLKLSVALIYVTVLGLLLSISNRMSYEMWLPGCMNKTIVVKYIHSTDGKKKN